MARLLYVLSHSTDDPDRAATALYAAASSARREHEVGLWLQGEGVRLGVRGVAETLREPGPGTATENLEAIVASGGRLHCSRRCFETRAFDESALRAGAHLVEPDALGALVDEGWTTVAT